MKIKLKTFKKIFDQSTQCIGCETKEDFYIGPLNTDYIFKYVYGVYKEIEILGFEWFKNTRLCNKCATTAMSKLAPKIIKVLRKIIEANNG